ncbi:unnamed protein product [Xylocopa violacea]|uniref:Cytochrome c1, heme protein, mitochondrial n=1 Tax=Xylocopa violacea TaxID=135666 RepID=A0ABP1NKM5_XYLVO
MMAAIVRVDRAVRTTCRKFSRQNRLYSSSNGVEWRESGCCKTIRGKTMRPWLGILAGMIGSCGALLYYLNESSVKAFGELEITLPKYPWAFKGVFSTFDHAALRRGWTVYRTVCRTCHSLQYVRFLDLVDATHTIEEVKQIAAEFEVEDGPDNEGNYYMRPAKLSDKVPSLYPNEEAARAANLGAYPPDLTYITLAHHNGVNYIFSLLTGFMDPPAGIKLEDGQYFNPYFPGGRTSMPPMLYDGMVEYDDGTLATESQMAKDVVEFLFWTANPEHDTRKVMMMKGLGICLILIASLLHMNRRYWSHIRSRRLAYAPNSVSREPQLPRVWHDENGIRGTNKRNTLMKR